MIARALQRVRSALGRRIGVITDVATTAPVAALTFDDGPHPEWTPRLLDLLDRHQAKATFFMVGEMAARHPELVNRIAGAGTPSAITPGTIRRFQPFDGLSGRVRSPAVRTRFASATPSSLDLRSVI